VPAEAEPRAAGPSRAGLPAGLGRTAAERVRQAISLQPLGSFWPLPPVTAVPVRFSISFGLPGLAARPQQLDFAHGLVRFVKTGAIQPGTQDRAAPARPLRKSLIKSARPGDRTGQIGISGSVVVEPSPNPDLYQHEAIVIDQIGIMKAAII